MYDKMSTNNPGAQTPIRVIIPLVSKKTNDFSLIPLVSFILSFTWWIDYLIYNYE